MIKLASTLLSLSLLFGFNSAHISAASSTEDRSVSGSEVRSRIDDLYHEYGVDYEFVDENDVSFTELEVEKELKKLEDSLKEIVERSNSPTVIEVEVSEVEASTDREEDVISTYSHISPQFMVHTHKYTTYANASNGITGNATIELSCIGTIKNSDGKFVGISDIKTRQYGSSYNFVSWTQISSNYRFYDNHTKAEVSATGTLKTEMTFLGQKIQQTYDHVIGMHINRV